MLRPNYQLIRQLITEKDASFLVLALSLFLLPMSINLSTFTFILAVGLKLVQTLFLKSRLFRTKALKQSGLIGFLFFIYVIINSSIQTDIVSTFNLFEKQISHWALLF